MASLAVCAAAPIPQAAGLLALPAAQEAAAPEAGPVSPDSADRLREALSLPPPGPPATLLDGLGVPLRALTLPLLVLGHGTEVLLGLGYRIDAPLLLMGELAELADWGLTATLGSEGARSGPGLGSTLRRFDPLRAETYLSVRGSQRHAVAVELDSERHDRKLEVEAGFRREAEPHFWGIGPDAREDAAADFRWDRLEARVGGRAPLAGEGRLSGRLGIAWEENRVGRGFDGSVPDLVDRAEPDELFGLREDTRFAWLDAGLTLDLTHREWVQRRGLLFAAAAAGYEGVAGTDSRFVRWTGEAVGYLPLNVRQQWALRLRVQEQAGEGGRGVPFTHLASLGGGDGLRGFDEGRFRDRAAADLAAEWRYEIWRSKLGGGRAEGVVLFDLGTVAPELSRLDEVRWHRSWGVGGRAVDASGVLFASYVAFSPETTRFRVSVSWPY